MYGTHKSDRQSEFHSAPWKPTSHESHPGSCVIFIKLIYSMSRIFTSISDAHKARAKHVHSPRAARTSTAHPKLGHAILELGAVFDFGREMAQCRTKSLLEDGVVEGHGEGFVHSQPALDGPGEQMGHVLGAWSKKLSTKEETIVIAIDLEEPAIHAHDPSPSLPAVIDLPHSEIFAMESCIVVANDGDLWIGEHDRELDSTSGCERLRVARGVAGGSLLLILVSLAIVRSRASIGQSDESVLACAFLGR